MLCTYKSILVLVRLLLRAELYRNWHTTCVRPSHGAKLTMRQFSVPCVSKRTCQLWQAVFSTSMD